jgi:hypothetical protein
MYFYTDSRHIPAIIEVLFPNKYKLCKFIKQEAPLPVHNESEAPADFVSLYSN